MANAWRKQHLYKLPIDSKPLNYSRYSTVPVLRLIMGSIISVVQLYYTVLQKDPVVLEGLGNPRSGAERRVSSYDWEVLQHREWHYLRIWITREIESSYLNFLNLPKAGEMLKLLIIRIFSGASMILLYIFLSWGQYVTVTLTRRGVASRWADFVFSNLLILHKTHL